jgi:RING finger/CHY zinc finger protein 1
MVDPKLFEAEMDQELANMPMPEDYKDVKMKMACNDCQFKSEVNFHILGGKCKKCGSYNTARIEGKVDRIEDEQ